MDHILTINESFLGIDIKEIKKKAFEFSKTKECREGYNELDPKLKSQFESEIKSIKNIETFVGKLVKKFSDEKIPTNEEIGVISIVSALFGLHATIKLIVKIQKGWSWGRYLGSLFYSDNSVDHPLRSIRDSLITGIFILFTGVYILGNKTWSEGSYYFGKDFYVNITTKWDGENDYIWKDNYGNIYNVIQKNKSYYDIIHNGKLIGHLDDNGQSTIIRSIDDKKLAIKFSPTYTEDVDGKTIEHRTHRKSIKVDLSKFLSGKIDSKDYKIVKHELKKDKIVKSERENDLKSIQKQLNDLEKKKRKLSHDIDSINKRDWNLKMGNYKLKENVNQARSFLKSIGKDYDEEIKRLGFNGPNDRSNLFKLKELLEKNGNLGYFGVFVKFVYGGKANYHDVRRLYEQLVLPQRVILDKLRDANGNLKPLVEFDNFEQLQDSLMRLREWSGTNHFIQQLPPKVKSLIWRNGWFIPELQENSQYLTTRFSEINRFDADKKRRFFSKISACHTYEKFMDLVQSATKTEPWTFTHWLAKLKKTRNVVVTWSSKDDKQIICLVQSYSAIRQIAYMTNWCIYRDVDYFNQYANGRYQFILYDFNYGETRNDSVIGFTLGKNFDVKYCHDKSDRSTRLPHKFLKKYVPHEGTKVKDEYLKVNWQEVLKKFDRHLISSAQYELRRLLNKDSRIKSFIDFYEGESD